MAAIETKRKGDVLSRALLLALAAHAGVLLGLRVDAARSSARPVIALPETPPTELVEVERIADDPEPSRAADVGSPRQTETAPPARPDRAPPPPERAARAADPTAPGADAPATAEGGEESSTAAETTPWVPPHVRAREPQAEGNLAALGVGGPNRFLTQGAEAVRPRPEKAAERAMKQALRDRDRDVGLGGGGPVLTALEDEVYRSTVPLNATAVFSVFAEGDGRVSQVAVVSSTGGDGRAWEEVAKGVLAALARKPLRVAKGAKGLALRIEVTSAKKMPSGHDPGVAVDIFGIPLSKGEGKQSTHISLLDPLPKVVVQEVSNPDVVSGVKLPQVSLQLTIFALAGDPVDIGARARRVVHAHVVEEELR